MPAVARYNFLPETVSNVEFVNDGFEPPPPLVFKTTRPTVRMTMLQTQRVKLMFSAGVRLAMTMTSYLTSNDV